LCELRNDTAHLALPVEQAAKELDAALRATHARRFYIAPLDLAEDLPPLAFGSARVSRLKPDALRALFDERRLKRIYQRKEFDADRFSEFHWLVVEEAVALDSESEARAVPMLFMDLGQDPGRIDPTRGGSQPLLKMRCSSSCSRPGRAGRPCRKSTGAVSACRGSIRSTATSSCVPLRRHPLDTLTWEDRIYDDGYGGTHEK
jgi:hypothetical protein